MSMNDLTSDLLTRIRNATRNRASDVRCVNSRLNRGVLDVLKAEGYINGFRVIETGPQSSVDVELRYGPRGEIVLSSIERVSKPGCRVYRKVEDLPRPVQGLGIAIVSTSHGVLSDRMCRKQGVGGEVIALVS